MLISSFNQPRFYGRAGSATTSSSYTCLTCLNVHLPLELKGDNTLFSVMVQVTLMRFISLYTCTERLHFGTQLLKKSFHSLFSLKEIKESLLQRDSVLCPHNTCCIHNSDGCTDIHLGTGVPNSTGLGTSRAMALYLYSLFRHRT